ncbi:MAG: tetratricopeptide repeat protein, partial [Gammaproteobacteria bacterium]|nr:tetratricopeptide repeat protein [Gammaproteobacteria bacterium]
MAVRQRVSKLKKRAHARMRAGRFDQAKRLFEELCQLNQADADIWFSLGMINGRQGHLADAEHCCRRAIAQRPLFAEAYFNLARACELQGKAGDADNFYRQVIFLQPKLAEARHNLAHLLQQQGRFVEAVELYQQALALKPDFAESHNNLGKIAQQQGELQQALAHYQRAQRCSPKLLDVLDNLSGLYGELGDPEQALVMARKALAIQSDYARAHFNSALALLSMGDYSAGWREYEWGVKAGERTPRDLAVALPWQGEDLASRTLLVYAEQGVGDEIMFASCLPDLLASPALHDQGGRCVVECDSRLAALFSRSFPQATVVGCAREQLADSLPSALSSVDYQLPIGSLPLHFRLHRDSFPQRSHYLVADAERCDLWQQKLATLGDGLKVGISWRGGGTESLRRQRSIELQQWHGVFAARNGDNPVHFINLQYGDVSDELEQHGGTTLHCWPEIDPLRDLDEFAALLCALDLVICVDNSSAHLSAALGTPTWLLLPFAADWRWLRSGNSSPWYSAVRLLRQPQANEWSALLEQVAADLAHFRAANDGTVTTQQCAEGEKVPVVQPPPAPPLVVAQPSTASPVDEVRARIEQLVSNNQLHEAYRLCQQLSALQLDDAEILSMQGSIAGQLGEIAEAERCCKKALQIREDFSDALFNLGLVYQNSERLDEAQACYRRATEVDPELFPAWVNYAINAYKQGQVAAAEQAYQKAIALQPDSADGYYNLAILLNGEGRTREALRCYEEALRCNPELISAYLNAAALYSQSGQPERAIAALEAVLQQQPGSAAAYNNLGNVLLEQQRVDEALVHYQRAIELQPEEAEGYYNLGNALRMNSDFEGALGCYREVLRLSPEHAKGHWANALALLTTGDLAQGWLEYEWGVRAGELFGRDFPYPVWDGSPLNGRSVLAYAAQGVGDEIMFASCLGELIAEAGRCVIECDSRLASLFRRSFPAATVIGAQRGEESQVVAQLDGVDVQVPIDRLPRFYRLGLASFPRRAAYLIADEAAVNKWRQRYAALGSGLKVGISWRGGNDVYVKTKAQRSTLLAQWQPLFDVAGVQFINLQYGDCGDELGAAAAAQGVVIHDWADADALLDLDDFAAQISALDRVISVDNSTVHMAGSVGT